MHNAKLILHVPYIVYVAYNVANYLIYDINNLGSTLKISPTFHWKVNFPIAFSKKKKPNEPKYFSWTEKLTLGNSE